MTREEKERYFYNLLDSSEKAMLDEKIMHLKECFESTNEDSYTREKAEYVEAYTDVFETCYKLEKEIPLRMGYSEDSLEYNQTYAGIADSIEGRVYDIVGATDELSAKHSDFQFEVLSEENSLG